MIPVEQKREVSSGGVEGTASFEISGEDAAHIMTILRDTLYSDKVLAVLREYASNAWDANRMAGRGDRPIEITLPSYGESVLKIRDHGPGLSLDDVFKVYNKYGRSTKRDSNEAVGMLGIGSKSGFAYSDSFTIVSWHGGKRMTFVAVIDDSEKGRVDLLDTDELPCSCGRGHVASLRAADCPQPETGVEIQIPVRPQDISEFERKAQSLFAFFKPQPKINTALPPVPKGKDFTDLGTILEAVDRYSAGSRGWTAVMGCVPYRVNLQQLSGLSNSARNVSGILYFDIGTLQVAASREELKYGDSTKQILTEKINLIIDKYVEHLLEGVDKLSQWERRLRVKAIKDMYLPVPKDLAGLDDSFIGFDKDPAFSLKGRSSYRNQKIEAVAGIRIDSKTRLVFRNEKRALPGYEFQDGDIIVDVTLDDRQARLALAKHLTKHRVEGIPMVNISTLKWNRPLTSSGKPVDPLRARAACLILDPKNLYADRKSERWIPTTRTPLDTDVYVVLDSYIVDGLADFYETYENDAKLLEDCGGKMPQVIGYRNTQATPVVRAKLKGTDYRTWRDAGYTKLLTSITGVAEGLKAKVWSDVAAYVYGLYADHAKMVGEQHPVGQYILAVLKGRHDYSRVDRKLHSAISRVHQSLTTHEAKEAWKKLVELYPLFSTMNDSHMSGSFTGHSKQWVEYIKTIDLHRELELDKVQDEQKKENAA